VGLGEGLRCIWSIESRDGVKGAEGRVLDECTKVYIVLGFNVQKCTL
jgi:hypothetical protein